jgi:ABC-type branched-subunit amino acid transport system substrate-binding protein
VVALFLTHGTAHSLGLIPLLNEFKIPLVAPSTGAMDLHQPVQPWVFNVRAPYQREVERAVRHLLTLGMDKIAIIQVDDAYGNDAVKGACKALEAGKVKPVAHEKYDRAKPDFATMAPKLAALQPQAVLFLGSGDTVVDGIRKLREAGSQAQIVTSSNNAAAGFIKQMGPYARGTIVSQVFPNERSQSVPLVKEALELAAATKGAVEVTPVMLEGFAGARVLVEGLRRAGREPPRASLRSALEGIHKRDLGGLELGFSATRHTGLEFSDIAIIGPDGRFLR